MADPTFSLVRRHQRALVLEKVWTITLLDHLSDSLRGPGQALMRQPWWLITVAAGEIAVDQPWVIEPDQQTIGASGLVVGSGGQVVSRIRLPPWVVDVGGLCEDADGLSGAVVDRSQIDIRGRRLTTDVDIPNAFERYTEDGVEYIDIWLRDLVIDTQALQAGRGFALRAPGDSSEEYQQLLDTFQQFVRTQGQGLRSGGAYQAMGIPTASGTEEVLSITTVGPDKVVVTDQAVYRFPAEQGAAVAVGQTPEAGAPMSDGCRIFSQQVSDIATDYVLGLTIGAWVGDQLFPLVAENRDHQWYASGQFLRFPVYGGDAFWDALEQQTDVGAQLGVSAGDTVNPMRLLLAGAYNHSFWLAATKVQTIRQSAGFLDWAGRYQPPGSYISAVSTFSVPPAAADTVLSPGSAQAFYIDQASDTLELSQQPAPVAPALYLG